MPNTLHEIVENKKREIAARAGARASLPTPAPARGSFLRSLRQTGRRLIAEIKPKSPSAGQLAENVDVANITRVYSRYAAAISVLTDEKYFGGSLEALRKVSASTQLPTLCKDFILDKSQVLEAREAGAEAVLLIVKILDDEQLARLHECIMALNMVPVVEVQNEIEIERARKLPLQCVLINNRNLETFETNLATTENLIGRVPAGIVVISASGIETAEDVSRLENYTNAFLVGSSLMRSQNLDAKLRKLAGVERFVKICGVTSVSDANKALEHGADLLGLIFVDESPRCVSLAAARQICATVGGQRVVGVFRDAGAEEILDIQNQVGFGQIQLHGTESPDVVSNLQPSIKAITVKTEADVRDAERYGTASFLLFDLSKQPSERVSTESLIQWINTVNPSIPFFVAGGLDAESVAKVTASITAVNFVGVDVASGVESSPGVKCGERLSSFIKEAKYNAVPR